MNQPLTPHDAALMADLEISLLRKENAELRSALLSSSKAEGEMREALRRVDHTLSVHGHVDADTDLHAFIRAALSKEGA